MFGLTDFWIWSVYLLCLLSALLCIGYGMLNWNHDGDEDLPRERQWAEEEEQLEDQL